MLISFIGSYGVVFAVVISAAVISAAVVIVAVVLILILILTFIIIIFILVVRSYGVVLIVVIVVGVDLTLSALSALTSLIAADCCCGIALIAAVESILLWRQR